MGAEPQWSGLRAHQGHFRKSPVAEVQGLGEDLVGDEVSKVDWDCTVTDFSCIQWTVPE